MDIYIIVTSEVLGVILDELPHMFETKKDQLNAMFDKCYAPVQTTTRGGQLRTREIIFRDFRAYGNPDFMGKISLSPVYDRSLM